jgi:hypothetical protein
MLRVILERYVKDTPLSPEELVNLHAGRRMFYLVSLRINLWTTV